MKERAKLSLSCQFLKYDAIFTVTPGDLSTFDVFENEGISHSIPIQFIRAWRIFFVWELSFPQLFSTHVLFVISVIYLLVLAWQSIINTRDCQWTGTVADYFNQTQ